MSDRPDLCAIQASHVGKVYQLTGPKSQDGHSMAAEYAEALGRPVAYVDVPFEQWRDQEFRTRGLPEYVAEHLLTMARLHAANRYDRLAHDVEAITGRPAPSVRDFVARNAESFARRGQGDTSARQPRCPARPQFICAPHLAVIAPGT